MSITVRRADGDDTEELAAVAAATFPLACPPTADPADVDATIAANLSAERFAGYLAGADAVVLVATDEGRIIGYTMLIHGVGADADVAASVPQRPTVELSKMYVLPAHHRSGAAAELMRSGIAWAAESGAAAVWLGVNAKNERAQRFYRKHGFEATGTRRFRLGSSYENDFVMVRPVR